MASAGAAQKRSPNFVVIMADDLGAKELGCYGHAEHRTPHLDRLAEGGVRFRTCWSTPICSSTRVELMTGRYGFRTGWYNFMGRVTTPMHEFDPNEPTFGDVLQSAGYATALAGKWQLGYPTRHPNMIVEHGFQEYCIWNWIEMLPDANFPGSPRQRYRHPAVIENGKQLPTRLSQYGPDVYCDWLIDFIRRNKDYPFLAYYPMCLTHDPWDPTPDSPDQGGLKPNVEYMDKLVGRIVKALDDLGLREDTIVLFTGDNGTGNSGKGKTTELGTRAPMIVNSPGRVQAGIVSDELTDLSDVLPTLADLAGADPPKGITLDGHSFAPLLEGKPFKPREWIFSYLGYERMLRDKRWLLEGDGRFFDCGNGRDGKAYKDVTDSTDPEVVAARKRFETLLADLPAPDPADEPQRLAKAKKVPKPQGKNIVWREHIIDDEAMSGIPLRGADGLAVTDFDKDGRFDIVSVHEDSDHIRIAFGSDDLNKWESHTLAEGRLAGQAEDVALGDLNGDGRTDFIVACENAHLVYFLAPPNPRNIAGWKAVKMKNSTGRGSWIRVKLADVNEDGKLDILAANKGGTSFSCFYLQGDPRKPDAWREVVIGECKQPINIRPVDLDDDGDLDLVASSRGERKIWAYENVNKATSWKPHLIHEGDPQTEGFMIEFADLDQDGRLDLITAADHGHDIYWFRQPKTWGRPWTHHLIGSIQPDIVAGLRLVDLGNREKLDLVVGGYSAGPRLEDATNISPTDQCGRLAWFEAPRNPIVPWTRHDISRRRRGMFDMFIPADVNRDDRVDLITTRGNSGHYDGVLWLEQIRADEDGPTFIPARKKDSPEVELP
jgi:arylsulfatase A-like enzyme